MDGEQMRCRESINWDFSIRARIEEKIVLQIREPNYKSILPHAKISFKSIDSNELTYISY